MRQIKAVVAAVAVASLSAPALAENCLNTSFAELAATACFGSMRGNINGALGETNFLNLNFAQYGTGFQYLGKSDDRGNGPFTSNPTTSKNGVLTFDTPLSGTFVIGLKAARQYSYYLFDAATPVSSLTFDTMAGVALNRSNIAQSLSHANLYVAAAVPEPQTYALMLAGLAAVGFVAGRRKAG